MAKEMVNVRLSTGQVKNDGRKISGFAMPYNQPSARPPGFTKDTSGKRVGFQVEAGAFGDFVSNTNIALLYGHDPYQILGRNGENLKLSDSYEGVTMEADLIEDDPLSDNVFNRISRGWIKEMSAGFRFPKDAKPARVEAGAEQTDVTVVLGKDSGVELVEVSVVPDGAFNGTSVMVTNNALSVDEALEEWISEHAKEKEKEKVQVSVGIDLRRFV